MRTGHRLSAAVAAVRRVHTTGAGTEPARYRRRWGPDAREPVRGRLPPCRVCPREYGNNYYGAAYRQLERRPESEPIDGPGAFAVRRTKKLYVSRVKDRNSILE